MFLFWLSFYLLSLPEKEPHVYSDSDDVEYELGSADEIFLAALNGRIKGRNAQTRQLRARAAKASSSTTTTTTSTPSTKGIRPRKDSVGVTGVTDDMLEQLINGLEKEAFFAYGLRQMRDNTMDGMLCCVCNDHECDSGNALVLCDGCNMAVHQHCYGIHELPVATWLCTHCLSHDSNAACVLCGGWYGGMKPTTDGRWAHVLCAMWFPEVSFTDAYLGDPIAGIENIDTEKWNKVC